LANRTLALVDTGGKRKTGVDTGGKFTAGANKI
jgi:hypothetical protein